VSNRLNFWRAAARKCPVSQSYANHLSRLCARDRAAKVNAPVSNRRRLVDRPAGCPLRVEAVTRASACPLPPLHRFVAFSDDKVVDNEGTRPFTANSNAMISSTGEDRWDDL